MRITLDLDIDEIVEQLPDSYLLREVKFRGLKVEYDNHDKENEENSEMSRLVNDHRLGKQGSSEALIKLCYDMVGKIV